VEVVAAAASAVLRHLKYSELVFVVLGPKRGGRAGDLWWG
jgi:hypothetical protein